MILDSFDHPKSKFEIKKKNPSENSELDFKKIGKSGEYFSSYDNLKKSRFVPY